MNFKFQIISKTNGIWIIGLYIIFCIQHKTNANKSEWLDNLTNYLQNNSREYQIMLLLDQNEDNKIMKQNDIVKTISMKLPAIKISFQNTTINKTHELSQLASFYTPRTTIYIIVYLSKDTQYMTQLIDFINLLSEPRRHPRCLIIFSQEEERFLYLKLLKRMWSSQFLDVTILELVEAENTKKIFSLNLQQKIIFIHQYNPFSKSYDRFKYSSTISWFPEKTHNLYGLQMKVGVIHSPPTSFLEINKTGHITNAFGKAIFLTESIAKSMNFKIVLLLLYGKDRFGELSCMKENLTGFHSSALHHKIDFFSLESARLGTCAEQFFEWSRGTDYIRFVLIVPVSSAESVLLSIRWKFYNTVLLVSLFLFTWILVQKMPFDQNNLSLLQVMQVALSTPILHEPRKLAERIVFGGILLSCLMNSSFIYIAFTDTTLKEDKKIELENIDAVVSSNLEPLISSFYKSSFYNIDEKSLKLLLEKTTEFEGSTQLCLNRLIEQKNVVCVRRADSAKWSVEKDRDNCGRPVSKIIRQPLKTTATGFVMAAGSPYAERFDEVLLILIQSGVVDKWQKLRFNRSSIIVDENESCKIKRGLESVQLRRQIIYVLTCGYVCAIVSFISEVLFAFFKIQLKKIPIIDSICYSA